MARALNDTVFEDRVACPLKNDGTRLAKLQARVVHRRAAPVQHHAHPQPRRNAFTLAAARLQAERLPRCRGLPRQQVREVAGLAGRDRRVRACEGQRLLDVSEAQGKYVAGAACGKAAEQLPNGVDVADVLYSIRIRTVVSAACQIVSTRRRGAILYLQDKGKDTGTQSNHAYRSSMGGQEQH